MAARVRRTEAVAQDEIRAEVDVPLPVFDYLRAEPIAAVGGTEENPFNIRGQVLEAGRASRAVATSGFMKHFRPGGGGESRRVVGAAVIHDADARDRPAAPVLDGGCDTAGLVEGGNEDECSSEKAGGIAAT